MTNKKPRLEPSETPETSGKMPLQSEVKEINGFKAKNLPEPTRYGDWEVGGRCSDF
jgi:hypothetical protein